MADPKVKDPRELWQQLGLALGFEAEALKAATSKITLRELWAHFITDHGVRASTYETYTHHSTHLLAFFGDREAQSINLDDVARYRDHRRNMIAKFRGRPTRPGTRNREVSLLKTVLNWGCRRGHIAFNQMIDAKDEEEDNVRENIMTEDMLDRVIYHGTPLLNAYVTLSVDSGLRRGEASTLQWPDLDPARGIITVSWRNTKTKQSRITILSDRAWGYVNELPRLGPFVFQNRRRKSAAVPYRPNYFLVQFKEAAERAGVLGPDGTFTLHDLRRTFVTMCRRRGVPETVTMAMSGHKSHEVFKRYNIVDPGDVLQYRAKLEEGRRVEMKRVASAKRNGPSPVHRAPARKKNTA